MGWYDVSSTMMGVFGVDWPLMLGYLAFQIDSLSEVPAGLSTDDPQNATHFYIPAPFIFWDDSWKNRIKAQGEPQP